MLKYATLCSGIGGFDLGFDDAGMQCVYQCEVDEQCQSILNRWWPNVPKGKDVNDDATADALCRLLVGSFSSRSRPYEILSLAESVPWDSPPSREAGTRVADCLTAGVSAGSGINRPGRRREDDVNLVARPLKSGGNMRHTEDHDTLIAATLNSGGNSGGFRTEPGEHLVVGALRFGGYGLPFSGMLIQWEKAA